MAIYIINVLLFLAGVLLMILDGSGGYTANMTWMSYLGIGLCILGIGFVFIKGGIQLLIEKIKSKK
jgi:hypothetical protein